MKLLVVGANGQLGKEVQEILRNGTADIGKIDDCFITAEKTYVDIDELDITDIQAVKKFFDKNFDIVINCSAYTNVKGAEEDFDTAYKVNALGARNLAIICSKIGAKLIHVSTDYVFDGNSNIPYTEADIANPQNVYGKTKLAGENFVKEFCPKSFIIRTSWLYGKYGKNFVYTMLNLGKVKDEINVVEDQIGTPTNANDLAYHILRIALTEEYGIYHVSGNGVCSWKDFAEEIMNLSGLKCRVNGIKSSDYPEKVKRPSYSVLDHVMLRLTVGDQMRNWKDAIKSFLKGEL